MNVNTGKIRELRGDEFPDEDEIALSKHEAEYLKNVKPENRTGVLSAMADDMDERIEEMRRERRPDQPRVR